MKVNTARKKKTKRWKVWTCAVKIIYLLNMDWCWALRASCGTTAWNAWKKSQKTSFLRPLTIIFSAFSGRALSGYLVYGFLLDRLNFPFQRWLSFPGLFFGKPGMTQWWERSPPTNVARVQIPASTPYVGWVCCWFSCFPLTSKSNISKFQFDQDFEVDEEPLCGCATSK